MNAHSRHYASAVSLQRLLTHAGAEFSGETFQKSDADRLGLSQDFKRAYEDGLIEQVAYPDWYEPTARGATALRRTT